MTPLTHPESSSRPGDVPHGLRVSEIISALSFGLDLTEGQPLGHAVRTCVIGMHIAREIGLPKEEQADLYYALLMKDAGCSTNASKMFLLLGTDDISAKRDVKTTDWTKKGWESLQYALAHVQTGRPFIERVRALFHLAVHQKQNAKEMVRVRCERGAQIARRIGLSERSASAIHGLDELWNGKGQPQGLRGTDIPLLSRIMNLAQSVDVFYTAYDARTALDMARKRSGHWFDPALVRALRSVAKRESFWADLPNARRRVIELEPRQDELPLTEATLDNICMAFADVIDAKSPFTFRHSTGVSGAAVAMAQTLGLAEPDVTMMRRAALLHDIGKLSVSNAILDKPDKLTSEEWEVVKKHPYYSYEILRRIPGFGNLSEIAASHHEKLDGSGYFRGYDGEHLSLPQRILVVADIYDALHAKRPYRDALPLETVFGIMQKDAPKALDPVCLEALKSSTEEASTIAADLLRLSHSVGAESTVAAPAPAETVAR